MARAISHAALTREILFLPLEHKIHIFSPPCNILYVNSYFIFTFYIRTSTNGHLSTTATLFCPGGRSIHLLLFKPLLDGHLSTAATDVNACSQLPKYSLDNGQFFYGDFRAMKSLTFNLYGTFMINRSNHIIYTATVSNNHYLRMILIANVSNLSRFISLTF